MKCKSECVTIKIDAVSLIFQNTFLKEVVSFLATYVKCAVYTDDFLLVHITLYSKLIVTVTYGEVFHGVCVDDYVIDGVCFLKAK